MDDFVDCHSFLLPKTALIFFSYKIYQSGEHKYFTLVLHLHDLFETYLLVTKYFTFKNVNTLIFICILSMYRS